MKKQTKTLMLSIAITLILLLTFTITYAVFTYQATGTSNNQLILGDIYMHYNESDATIDVDNMMPINIEDYTTYKVNSVMKTQNLNELSVCVSMMSSGMNASSQGKIIFTDFCQEKNTFFGLTFQEWIADGNFSSEQLMYLEEKNVIISDGESYYANPIMKEQSLEENVLYNCMSYYFGEDQLNSGVLSEEFCKETGVIDGNTFQDYLDQYYFDNRRLEELLSLNVIQLQIKDLPYFEFTISGKNTYSEKDIYYDILLDYGNVPEGKIESERIEDNFLRFALVEIKEDDIQTMIFLNGMFSNLDNKQIYTETISKNTMEEINRTYRLYMWIDESIVIGNTNQDYTTEEWDNLFASIKVNVTGNFEEKEFEQGSTDESCFYTTVENDEIIITGYNNSCGSDVVIPAFINNYKVTTIGDRAFFEKNLTSVIISNTVTSIEVMAFARNDLSKVIFQENSNLQYIDEYAFGGNAIEFIEIPDTVNYIGISAFAENLLETIIIGRGVNYIYDYAFAANAISYGILPDRVTSVTIKGKSSLDEFETYGASVFGWAEGYSDDDIVFEP